VKEQAPVDPLVAAFHDLAGSGANEAKRPSFELERIVGRESGRIIDCRWLTNLDNGLLDLGTVTGDESMFDQPNRQVRHIDPDPVTSKRLGRVDGRPAAAERVEDNVTNVGRR
jgi:hypothetical protein